MAGSAIPICGTRPGEGEKPGLWLVGDQGVYIMSNGKIGEGERSLVIYSAKYHPAGNPDWRDYKRRWFGGYGGIEYIEADHLIPDVDRNFRATHLQVSLSKTEIRFSLITS